MKRLTAFAAALFAVAAYSGEPLQGPALQAPLPGLFRLADGLTVNQVVAVEAATGVERQEGGSWLGVGYWAIIQEPDFVQSLAMALGPDPDCKGKGLSFARCVKERLDEGEACKVHKEGEVYHAHCEERPT